MQQLLMCGGNGALRVVDGADFDGTFDYMKRGAGLTGAADSKKGILSFWLNTWAVGSNVILRSDVAGLVYNNFTVGNTGVDIFFFMQVYDSSGTSGVNQNTTVAMNIGTWYHILASWDCATTTSHLYKSDVSDQHFVSANADVTIDYTHTDWVVGASITGTLKYPGYLAEFYYAPGQYLDFSSVANRRKFISASCKPFHLGTDGSLPTGTAPLMYHHLDNGEAVANFATNRGTGGNFTITGTLATSASSPSD